MNSTLARLLIWAYLAACAVAAISWGIDHSPGRAAIIVAVLVALIALSLLPSINALTLGGAAVGATLPVVIAIVWRLNPPTTGGADIGYGLFVMALPVATIIGTLVGAVLGFAVSPKQPRSGFA